MPVTVQVSQPGFATTVEALRLHSWKLGPGQPTLVPISSPTPTSSWSWTTAPMSM